MATAAFPAGRRPFLPAVRRVTAQWVAVAAAKARAWHLHAIAPGLSGAGLVSAGLGLKFGAWAGLITAGVFLLRADSRL